jgi:hypothetical protein
MTACSLDVSVEDLDPSNYSASTIEAIGPFVADGITAATIKIYVMDNGKPIEGFTPIYKVSGSGNLLGQCSETNSHGLSTCLLRSTVAGRKTISLVSPDTKAKIDVVFVPGIPAKAGFSISSGGGVQTSGSIMSSSSIGLVSSSILLDDGSVVRARVGLQGVLYEGN